MQIWTIQNEAAWAYLRENGHLRASREHQAEEWLDAYCPGRGGSVACHHASRSICSGMDARLATIEAQGQPACLPAQRHRLIYIGREHGSMMLLEQQAIERQRLVHA